MRILRRLKYWWRFDAASRELAEELSLHREAIERDLLARGLPPNAARDAARRAMGNETLMREEARGVWIWPALEAVWQDARGTIRSLLRSPAFTLGVTLTFALGVGANVAMFSLIDRLMLRPPPLMRDAATVNRVYLYHTSNGVERTTGDQVARFFDLQRLTSSFSDVAGHTLARLAVGVGQDARELPIGVVTANFFEFFDAPPVAGRYFTSTEDATPTGAPVAVLSHSAWQSRYGGRADAIGAQLQIGAIRCTIVGVAPPDLVGLWPFTPPTAYIPVSTYAGSVIGSDWPTTYESSFGLETLVRRKPGISVEVASADLQRAFLQSIRQELGDLVGVEQRMASIRPRAVAGPVLLERGPERSSVASVATWLGGVTIIVLLIACANVANLLLARSLTRRREIAVRLALGVSRMRLLSQMLTESMLLALAGSALGIAVAVWLSATLTASFLPGSNPPSVASDPRTLAFVAIMALAVGLFSGLLPMWQARRLTITTDLKSGARAGTHHRSVARSILLVSQGALSVVLLVGAGLFVRSLHHVADVPLGFDADSVLMVDIEMRDVTLDSAQAVSLRHRLLAAATAVPGIQYASQRRAEPFGGMSVEPLRIAGIDSTWQLGLFLRNTVSPDYFRTMGTRLLRGRGIEPGDVAGAPRVMVIGESMGAVLWPGEEPLGKCVRIGRIDTVPCTYVVGVAEDIQIRSFDAETRLFYYYLPVAQKDPHIGGLFVRASGDPARLIEPLRRRLQQEMPGSSYVTVGRLGELIEGQTRSWVMGATAFSAFGVLALVLAAVGLYSVIAYSVAQRRQELAVRVALGASAGGVARLVVAEGLRFSVSGVMVGGALAFFAGPWIAPLLFNESPRDPVVFGIVAGALLVVATLASALPALRGARANPSLALRAE